MGERGRHSSQFLVFLRAETEPLPRLMAVRSALETGTCFLGALDATAIMLRCSDLLAIYPLSKTRALIEHHEQRRQTLGLYGG